MIFRSQSMKEPKRPDPIPSDRSKAWEFHFWRVPWRLAHVVSVCTLRILQTPAPPFTRHEPNVFLTIFAFEEDQQEFTRHDRHATKLFWVWPSTMTAQPAISWHKASGWSEVNELKGFLSKTSPLHEAVKQKNPSVVAALLQLGADADFRDFPMGRTAFEYAERSDSRSSAELTQIFRQCLVQLYGFTMFHLA